MRTIPVVAEAAFLHHSEQFVVGHLVRGCGYGRRKWRLLVIGVNRGNFVRGGLAAGAEEVFVAREMVFLDADRRKVLTVERAIKLVVANGGIGGACPREFHVPIIALRAQASRRRRGL